MSTVAEGRAKRQIAPNAKQNALARLADLKKNGGRRTEQYQVLHAAEQIESLATLLHANWVCTCC